MSGYKKHCMHPSGAPGASAFLPKENCANMQLKVKAGTPPPLAPAAADHTRQSATNVAAWRVLPRAAKLTLAAGTAVTPPKQTGPAEGCQL